MNSRSCGGFTLKKNTLFQGGIFCECRLRCILHMLSAILLAECIMARDSEDNESGISEDGKGHFDSHDMNGANILKYQRLQHALELEVTPQTS